MISDLRQNGIVMDEMNNIYTAPPMPVPIQVESDIDDDELAGAAEPENQDIRGSDDDEQEDPKDYCKGGYHPVAIGSVFNQRYHVIRKLGWGMYQESIILYN